MSIIGKNTGDARAMYKKMIDAGYTDDDIVKAFGQSALDLAKGGKPSAQALAASTELTGQAQSRAARNVYENTLEATGDPGAATDAARMAAGKEAGATFTVRTVISEVGVEKVYPINSPMIAKVEIVSSPKKVHRSKLYYVRKLSSKGLREKLKI